MPRPDRDLARIAQRRLSAVVGPGATGRAPGPAHARDTSPATPAERRVPPQGEAARDTSPATPAERHVPPQGEAGRVGSPATSAERRIPPQGNAGWIPRPPGLPDLARAHASTPLGVDSRAGATAVHDR